MTKSFSRAFEQIENKEAFIAEYMDLTGYSVTTFYNHCSGRFPAKEQEASVIERLFEGFGINECWD